MKLLKKDLEILRQNIERHEGREKNNDHKEATAAVKKFSEYTNALLKRLLEIDIMATHYASDKDARGKLAAEIIQLIGKPIE